jgi:hypothetical protein
MSAGDLRSANVVHQETTGTWRHGTEEDIDDEITVEKVEQREVTVTALEWVPCREAGVAG